MVESQEVYEIFISSHSVVTLTCNTYFMNLRKFDFQSRGNNNEKKQKTKNKNKIIQKKKVLLELFEKMRWFSAA